MARVISFSGSETIAPQSAKISIQTEVMLWVKAMLEELVVNQN